MLSTPPSLLERLRGNPEPTAWDRFVHMYTPLFFSWTRRLGLARQDAAELVQDIFVQLVERLPHFEYDPRQSFRAWLKTMLLNRWRNWLRRSKKAPAFGLTMADVLEDGPVPELEETEYAQYVVDRALAIMQADFEPATWKACWEYVVQGRNAEEVVRELNMSVNAVYLAKSRVLRRLREELQGLLD